MGDGCKIDLTTLVLSAEGDMTRNMVSGRTCSSLPRMEASPTDVMLFEPWGVVEGELERIEIIARPAAKGDVPDDRELIAGGIVGNDSAFRTLSVEFGRGRSEEAPSTTAEVLLGQ